MEHFDVIVIGAGSGLTIVDGAARMGLKVALIEEGPMGGTCLNRGCIPSKMLIHTADIAQTITESGKFGIRQKSKPSINFSAITSRVSSIVDKEAREIEQSIRSDSNITLFKKRGKFIGKKKLQVGKQTITGDKIFIFAGTRTLVPPIKGLQEAGYLTSTEALRLNKLPKSLTVIGGGYIAAELAHFFGALGSKVNIIQRNDILVPNEDAEVAQTFTDIFKQRFNVYLGYVAESVAKRQGKYVVTATKGKNKKTIVSEQLLLAVGRVPNSDILDVQKTGVTLNQFGYVVTDDYLQTSVKGVWAAGDIAGKYLFKHSANLEAQYLFKNAFHPSKKEKVDYYAMPHAVFSSPQIAGVGAREQDLKQGTYVVGRYNYIDTGMGTALQDTEGFVKFLVDRATKKILGCQIIGTDASTLIHEVIVAMRSGGAALSSITSTVHIHPALSEVVQRAAQRAAAAAEARF